MDQDTFNKMLRIALENDETVRHAIENISQNARKHRDSEVVHEFRKDIARWVEQTKNQNVSRMAIQNGLYGAIRLKLGLKSMNALNDTQLPEARAVFQKFKEDFDV